MQEGTAIARGRGELTPLDDRGPMLDLVLVVPIFQVSTAEVYQAYEVSHDHQNIETAVLLMPGGTGILQVCPINL